MLDSEKIHFTWSKGCNFPKHRASQGQAGRERSPRENRILFLWILRWQCSLFRAVGEARNPSFCLPWSFLKVSCDLHCILQSSLPSPSKDWSPNGGPWAAPFPGLLPTWPHFQILSLSLPLSSSHTGFLTLITDLEVLFLQISAHGSLCHLLRSLLKCHLSRKAICVNSLLKTAHHSLLSSFTFTSRFISFTGLITTHNTIYFIYLFGLPSLFSH